MFSIFYIYIKIYPFKFLWFLTWDRRKIIVQTDAQDIPETKTYEKEMFLGSAERKKPPAGVWGR